MSDSKYIDASFGKILDNIVDAAPTYSEAAEDQFLHGRVDKEPTRPNDRRMTDINRQQVADMLSASESKVDSRLANFDTSVKTGFADLRAEFADMRAEMAKQTGEMRAEMANVRADSHKATTEVTRWVVGFGIAILGAIFAFARFSDRPTAAPVAVAQPAAHQQAPLVVTVPAGSTVLSAPPVPAAVTAQPAK